METQHPKEIVLTPENIGRWPKFKEYFDKGDIITDRTGRLRYRHGAPVGRLILTRILKDGTPRYQESAKEWFDPDSQRAKEFV